MQIFIIVIVLKKVQTQSNIFIEIIEIEKI